MAHTLRGLTCFGLLLLVQMASSVELKGLSVHPSTVDMTFTTTGMVSLSEIAPSGGIRVELSDNSPWITTPSSVTVAEGDVLAAFTIQTYVGYIQVTRQIYASYGGVTKSADLTLRTPPGVAQVLINPNPITGGEAAIGKIILSKPAWPGGVRVQMITYTSAIILPETVLVPEGQTKVNFPVATKPVGADCVREVLGRHYYSVDYLDVTLLAVRNVSEVTVDPVVVVGGTTAVGTVSLSGWSPSSATVTLTTDSLALTVPPTVVIQTGTASSTFSVEAGVVHAAYVRHVFASYRGLTKAASVTLVPGAYLAALSVHPETTRGGVNVTGAVALTSVAPLPGLPVQVSTSSANIVVPAEVTVPTGELFRHFTVVTSPVVLPETGQVFAVRGGVTKVATLTLMP